MNKYKTRSKQSAARPPERESGEERTRFIRWESERNAAVTITLPFRARHDKPRAIRVGRKRGQYPNLQFYMPGVNWSWLQNTFDQRFFFLRSYQCPWQRSQTSGNERWYRAQNAAIEETANMVDKRTSQVTGSREVLTQGLWHDLV